MTSFRGCAEKHDSGGSWGGGQESRREKEEGTAD